MCGRFNVDAEGLDDVYQSFVGRPFAGASNFNTAPTETAWIIRADPKDAPAAGGPLADAEAKWSLTPHWAGATPKYATFNAKAETLTTSRTFREPFHRRRCVVPVSGFYEWRRRVLPTLFNDGAHRAGRGGPAQPYYVRPRRGALLLAGVWDRWRRGGQVLDSFAIVTTPASEALAFLHHRQPLLLSSAEAPIWLRADADSEELARLLAPRVPVELLAAPVSRYVGDARNKGRRCMVPVAAATAIARDQ